MRLEQDNVIELKKDSSHIVYVPDWHECNVSYGINITHQIMGSGCKPEPTRGCY